MATKITDRVLEASLKASRRVSGADRYDEVWEGVTMMTPMPNDEHQQIVMRLASIFQEVIDWPGLGDVRPGVNVSDRAKNWHTNYRVPDVAVFLKEGHARNCDAYWLGGPDFAVEVLSPDDLSREKLPFYDQVGVRELLLVDRAPWQLELYGRDPSLKLVDTASLGSETTLASQVIPFTFRLLPAAGRPQIEVIHTETGRAWNV